jgi:peptide/nickel transport system substrate-binding protein
MKKVFWLALLLVLVIGLVFTGCANATPSPTPAQTSTPPKTSTAPAATSSTAPSTPVSSVPATITPKKGGTFRIAESLFPANLGWVGDPGWLIQPTATVLFLDTILKVDHKNDITPNLATAYTISPDLKSITLTLRKGVKFHDGSDLNASVVKWNFDFLINNKTGDWAKASSAEVIDDYTVKVNLNTYINSIMSTIGGTFVVSKAAYDSHGGGKDAETWMRSNPVGTGPFKLESFKPTVSLRGVRNENYWQPGKPYLDAIEINMIPDPMTRAQSFEAKENDADLGNISKIEADLKAKGYTVYQSFLSVSTLVPDSATASSPLANMKVRQAIDYAIDKESIVKSLGFGFTAVDHQFAIPGTSAYIANLANFRPYNLEKAKQLLADAGFPGGFKTKILGSQVTTNKDVMTAIQGMLSKLNITIDLNLIDHPAYTDQIRKGWEGMAAASKLVDANMNYAIATSWMPPAHPSMAKPDEYQALYNTAAASKDYDPALTQKVIQYMYDNAMIICLYADPRLAITQNYVKDPGFFTEGRALNWQPEDCWLDK